jgi:hypothetical protein
MIMALTLGAAMLGIAACGGDDNDRSGDSGAREELNLVDYFSAVADISKTTEEKFDTVAPDFGGGDATLDERKSVLVAFLEEIRDIAREFVAEFEDIDPPEEAQTLHADSLEAGNELVKAIDGIITEIEGFDSLSDILGFDAPDLGAASERLDAICADLQKLADGEEIDVDLSCD